MMPIPGFPGGHFQAGDQARFRIQADMGFVAIKVFGLLDLLAFFRLDLALMLDTPLGIRVMWPFAFALPLLIFGGMDVGYTVNPQI